MSTSTEQTTTGSTEAPDAPGGDLFPPTGSPTVEWKKAVMRGMDLDGSEVYLLFIRGRQVLTALADSPLIPAVSAKDRALIGQALANHLSESENAVITHDERSEELGA